MSPAADVDGETMQESYRTSVEAMFDRRGSVYDVDDRCVADFAPETYPAQSAGRLGIAYVRGHIEAEGIFCTGPYSCKCARKAAVRVWACSALLL